MALPLVAVVGALGTQGGSVVQALSKSGSFRARALTRNTESEKALRLKALQNVDLVRFDANDPALVKLAFDGADYVFAMTAEGEDETANGKLMIEVALHVGIKFFVFSSLPDPSPYVVPFFSKKHAVSQFLFDSVLPGCGIMLPFFMENFLDMGWIQKGEDGVVDLKFIRVPETKSTYQIAVNPDLGNAVVQILKHVRSGRSQPNLNHKDFILGDKVGYGSVADIAKIITDRTGLSTRTHIQPVFEPEGGEYDELFAKNAGTRDDGFFEHDVVPSDELAALGLKFTSLSEYVSTVVVPALQAHSEDQEQRKPIGKGA